MNDHYSYLIKSVSVGVSDGNIVRMSQDEAEVLLQKVLTRTGAKPTRNGYHESGKYFIYIGTFPSLHVAVDNKSGTTRLYSIDHENQINKIVV